MAKATRPKTFKAFGTRDEKDVLAVIRDPANEIPFVRLIFPDILGRQMDFTIPASELEAAFKEGKGFDGSSIAGFVRIEESDLVIKPDPRTFRVLPWTYQGFSPDIRWREAVMFGDGGITAIGANCLNMAVVMPFVGWGVYRLIAGRSEVTSRRRWIGAAVGGYIGLNAAALSTAIMFGIQPLIAHDAAGRALYSPYPLKIAVPIMAAEHLLFFGIVEAVVTGLVVAYLQKADSSLLGAKA